MVTRYCGPGGNDGNSGLTWAQRKLTINGIEDTPVVAGDLCYIAPGVYRETLTCDVSGLVGQPITYVADTGGEHTDGIGGIVRISGSNNDQAAVRNNCIVADAKNFRTFRGFMLDACSQININTINSCTNWIIEDCSLFDGLAFDLILISGNNQANWIIRRCFFFGTQVHILPSGNTVNANHLIQNCVFIGAVSNGSIYDSSVGGIAVRNCIFMGNNNGVWITGALPVGYQPVVVNNCNFYCMVRGCIAIVPGEIVENANNFYANSINRVNVAVGALSTAYPPVFQPPLLNSGVNQISGFQLPWTFGALSSWSQLRAVAGANEATEDLFGLARPVTAALNSWGPIQYQQVTQDTATVRTGTLSQEFTTAGRRQLIIPVQAVNTTITVWVYREANYAGVLPQMVLKQSGQADIVITDAGGAGAWNQLTHTWIPAASPTWLAIELVSNNTAAAGAFAVYFDDLTVSPLDTDTQEAWLTNEQPVNYAEEATVASAAFSPVGGEIVGV